MADIALSNFALRSDVQEKTTHRVRKYGFGDGYTLVAPDGINTDIKEYSIKSIPMSSADAATFQANLDSVCRGDFFVATLEPYTDIAKRYRLKDSTYTRQSIPFSLKSVFSFTLQVAYSGAVP